MNELLTFLAENPIVFLATSDKGEARVRPFQYQFEDDGRLWFCSAKSKEVYAQLQSDPRLEFSCTSKDMRTLRIKGKANLDDDMEIKKRIITDNALVRSIYGEADNPDFTVFSVDHGSGILFDLTGKKPVVAEF
ncbi:pyridoxamine 5'-phosphate oxidase family protein [Desulfovibrio inopinatus]|uniref:pyridoxamine 5'-phosphate oxidase family protein n=1 Tax=Desulfovibrio inopinatus TaxID=102109 RepID=UPI000429E69A|nr:pyridoxamine 5'-phosphate oxidase family protein [Desulfovibrio inopinatus]